MGPDYERQANLYEDWLGKQAMYLDSQVKMFEGQVNKLKRSKKTIQARQRLVRGGGMCVRVCLRACAWRGGGGTCVRT